MLEVLKVIIFGIVEGITEWLPISSTGHLILLEQLLQLLRDQGEQAAFTYIRRQLLGKK